MNDLQIEKAEKFHRLHHTEEPLVLPNIWEPLGACLLEDLGYPAVATGSASVAFTHGYDDGEQLPLTDLLTVCRRISSVTDLPLTADMESGYAQHDSQLAENVKRMIGAGVVGINIEDTNMKQGRMYAAEEQAHRIRVVRETARELGLPLFINARTDVFLHPEHFAGPEKRLEELIKRGQAYKEAGANGFFPIFLTGEEEIKELHRQLDLPVNLLAVPGIPSLERLRELGTARVSLGPGFQKIAIKAMRDTAMQLKMLKGLEQVTENDITTPYLKKLIRKK